MGCDGGRGVCAAHPRSRGENAENMDQLREAARLIPAHAGKTDTADDVRDLPGAHPRSRGENAQSKRLSTTSAGSSPLTRGKQGGGRLDERGARLIPAHAGKTGCVSQLASTLQAHPRSRGENYITSCG